MESEYNKKFPIRSYDHVNQFKEFGFPVGFILKNITWPIFLISGLFIFFVSFLFFIFFCFFLSALLAGVVADSTLSSDGVFFAPPTALWQGGGRFGCYDWVQNPAALGSVYRGCAPDRGDPLVSTQSANGSGRPAFAQPVLFRLDFRHAFPWQG